MEFRTDVLAKYVDLIGFPMEFADEECEMYSTDATLEFKVELESRGYGIKHIGVHTKIVEIRVGDHELTITPWSPIEIDGDPDIDEWDGGEWDIVNEVDLEHKQIIPDRVEIDWKERKVYVYYG